MIGKTELQRSLFESDNPKDLLLEGFVPEDNPWVILAKRFPWDLVEEQFGRLYSLDNGAPSVPVRRMVGLLLISQMENLSDDKTVQAWQGNYFYQYFCGELYLQNTLPCSPSLLSVFRKRIGDNGVKFLFALSVNMLGKGAEEKRVQVDTTVQPKNIAYPTDSKLYIGVMKRLHKIILVEGIKPRQSYVWTLAELRLELRYFGSSNKKLQKKGQKALKRLRTSAKALLRDVTKKLPASAVEIYAHDFDLYWQVLNRKVKDKNKIYSLHEKDVSCIAKGKAGKKYEFGSKCSIVRCEKSGVIVGAAVHEGNPHDSRTLSDSLDSANANRKSKIAEVSTDRGYKGAVSVNDAKVLIPGSAKYTGGYSARTLKKIFRARAGIEPVIGHLKSDFKLGLCRLKGRAGDVYNLLMSCVAWNLKLFIRGVLRLFFVFLTKIAFLRHFFQIFIRIRHIS